MENTAQENKGIEYNSKEFWAMSILSDAQELLAMGFNERANSLINDAKRVLMGKYKIVDDNFIEIERGLKN